MGLSLNASGGIPATVLAPTPADKLLLRYNASTGQAEWAGAWTAFTPSWAAAGANPVIGNGSVFGRYVQVGKTVTGRIYIAPGSSTTFGSGYYIFGLPVAANTSLLAGIAGKGIFNRGGIFYPVLMVWQTSSSVTAYTTASPGVIVTNTAPATWVNGDWFSIEFTYEAA
jgi:hypothetical protein